MYARTTVVSNASGLHARPAAVFAKTASGFESNVTVRKNEAGSQAQNARSILGLMALGLNCGAEIEIAASGVDEQTAVNALVELVESGCGE